MSDPSGWLWLILGVVGVGGLAGAIAYGSALWSRRRKDPAARRRQNQVVHENYQKGG